MFYAFEAVRGRPLSERAQEIGFRIGLAFVLMLSAALAPRGAEIEDVVPGGEQHQHQHEGQPDAEADLLRSLAQGAPGSRARWRASAASAG
jgi:hypothetical protein